jgi:fructosamine-3-kinase
LPREKEITMSWKTGVEKLLSEKQNSQVTILSEQYVGGGSINDARLIETTAGKFFVKINSASRYPGMFEKEAKGLALLDETKAIAVPRVIGYGENGNDAYLIQHFIDTAPKEAGFWENFGRKLATLHQNNSKQFGLDYDNYIGSLKQSNKQHGSWSAFFREERLEPQIAMAYINGSINSSMLKMFDRFFNKLDNLFPEEPPSLIHGDLWGGNFMVNEKGKPVIIDPAVYYGHREMDLGMSKLFGGFDQQFYNAYHKSYPLEPGWQERLDFCNLYPLMVHVNLFGGSYAGSVRDILKRF